MSSEVVFWIVVGISSVSVIACAHSVLWSAPADAEIVHLESGSAFATLRLSSADMLHETWRVIVAAEMAWRANFPNAGTVAIDD